MAHAFSARTNVLLANAGRYRAQLQPGESKKRTGMVVVTCMDARFNVYALLGLNECDAHILRNAGGVVTDDVIRSLAISQRLFETTDVMVITHAACGLRDITDEQLTSAVQADVGGRAAWPAATFRDVTAEARRGVARLRSTTVLRHTNGIRGFCFDETTGELHELC
jgi:carbonic anhydrase